MKASVPITKNRLRTRVRNSRRAMSTKVRTLSLRMRPGSSSRANPFLLRHRLAKDVEQAGHVAPEFPDRPGCERRLQHLLVALAVEQLQQPARPGVAHD